MLLWNPEPKESEDRDPALLFVIITLVAAVVIIGAQLVKAAW